MLEDNDMFHHPKLIADGLLSFKGNKEELALVLWEGRSKWSETMLVAIIQYITAAQDNFRAIFYEGLQEDDIPVEARIAILRYFQKYRYDPVREFLYTYIKEDYPELNCTIVAASVLKNYPGEETIKLLKDALKNPNWYVRNNAAGSLVQLAENEEVFQSVFDGDDQYAKEILQYRMEEVRKEG